MPPNLADQVVDRYFADLAAEAGPAVERASIGMGGGGASGGMPSGVTAGALGYGAGGPVWLDAYHSKRPPTPQELVNAYKSVAYACIQMNAKGVGRVPLRLYARTKPGQREPRRSFRRASDRTQRHLRFDRSIPLSRSIDTNDEVHEILDHPILDALRKPNEYFDQYTLMLYLVACLDAIGSAFLFPTRPSGADGRSDPTWAPTEIWPLQPQYVYPVKAVDGSLVGQWRYFGDSFEQRELVRVRHVSVRDPYLSAYAPLHACYEQIGLVDYYTASVEGILKGGAMPAAVIGAKDPLYKFGDEERKRFENDINNKMTGTRKGRIWVLDGAFDLTTLSYSPVDLGGLELTKEQRLLAANCFDVPISLLQSEDSNRAVASEGTHQHQYYAIAPRCCMIDSALTHQLAEPIDDRLFFAFDDPVSRDNQADATVFDMKIKNGTCTINEARADEQLPPVPWGDEPWFATSLVQPSAAAETDDESAGDKTTDPESATTPGVATDDVQAAALNGAQITSLLAILQQVAAGDLPPETASAALKASFPTLSDAQVAAMLDPLDGFEPPKPEPPAIPPPNANPAAKPPPDVVDPAGENVPAPPADPERSALYGRLTRVLVTLETDLASRRERGSGSGNRDRGDLDGGALPE